MKIKVDKNKIHELDYVKGKPMLDASPIVRLIILVDFKYEVVKVPKITITGLFRKSRTVTEVEEIHLTELRLSSWNNTAKFWGLHEDEGMLDRFINGNDLIKLRRDFIERIMDPIRSIGFDIIKKPKIVKE